MKRKDLAYEIAKNEMLMIKSRRIRNHKLGNSSRNYTGEVKKKRISKLQDFLAGKNGCMAYELTGKDYYE